MTAPSRPVGIVIAVGCLWGLYWLPLRQIEATAPIGTWSTLLAVGIAALSLAAIAGRDMFEPFRAAPLTLVSTALGGASFVFYSNGLLYGDVAVVILLFYTTPIWSVVLGRVLLGWPIAGWRLAAVGTGVAGIALVLGGSHGTVPLPHELGDWLGLLSAVLWALASTGIRTQARLPALQCNLVFCLGAVVAACACALLLSAETTPFHLSLAELAAALAWAAVLGGVWWAIALTLFLWSAQRLEPARVGILLMGEVVVGTLSGVFIAGESLGPLMILGSILVVSAAVIETWPWGDEPNDDPAGSDTR